jgi:CubicO group peptidase (beta-lactamase class C family)
MSHRNPDLKPVVDCRPALTELLEHAIGAGVFPGCVVGIVDQTGNRVILPVGRHAYDASSPSVSADTVYDVASLTKVVPTSTLALMLVDQGRLLLGEPVRKYLPEMQHSQADKVTVHHLLTHTLDFDFRLSATKNETPQRILQTILTSELRSPPGATFCYANATSVLLGMVIERVLGAPLDVLGQEFIFDPLDMKTTTFSPDELDTRRIVPTEEDPWRGRVVRGEVHDESAWKLRAVMVPGSAGLFSTVPDLMAFVEVLVGGGAWRGVRLFGQEMCDRMALNQLSGGSDSTGLGWELDQVRFMGMNAPQVIGKTGFTGCLIMFNTMQRRGVVILSNCTWPRRKPDRSAIDEVRRGVADLVFGKAHG